MAACARSNFESQSALTIPSEFHEYPLVGSAHGVRCVASNVGTAEGGSAFLLGSLPLGGLCSCSFSRLRFVCVVVLRGCFRGGCVVGDGRSCMGREGGRGAVRRRLLVGPSGVAGMQVGIAAPCEFAGTLAKLAEKTASQSSLRSEVKRDRVVPKERVPEAIASGCAVRGRRVSTDEGGCLA